MIPRFLLSVLLLGEIAGLGSAAAAPVPAGSGPDVFLAATAARYLPVVREHIHADYQGMFHE